MKHSWLRKGYLRLLMALGLMVVLQGLYAQTWTWQQQCSSNEWSEICGGTTVCGTNPTTYAYYGNWGTWSCGYNPSALRPGPGSTAIFPSGANALLASSVDIRNVSINNGATLAFTAGTLRLRHPENDAPGTLTVQSGGLFRLPSTSSYRYLAGVVVNTGTLRHEASGLWWEGASVQSSGTIELLAGNWYNNSGANSAQNTGTVVKSGTGTFTLGVPFDNRGTVSVQQGELRISGGGTSGSGGVWNVASGATLSFSNHTLAGSHTGNVQGLAQITGTLSVASAGASINLSGNGLAFIAGTLNAGSAGLTNAGVFRLPSTSSYRYLAGVVVNTGTLRHEASGLWWEGASVQSSGTIELLAGNWYNNSGANSAQNTGTVVKSGTGTFTLGVPFDNRGTVSVQQGELRISGGGTSGSGGVWNVASGATLSFSNHTLAGSHTGNVQGLAQITGTLSVASAGASINLSGNGLAFIAGTLNAGSAGLTNAGVFRLPSTSSYRYLAGVVVNTGTLRHESDGLWWNGASVQSSGTIELLAGNWVNNSGTNSAQNARGGKLLKLSSSSFSIGFLVRNAGLIDYREGSLSINRLVQTDGETRIHAGRTLTLSNPMELQGGKLTGAGTLSANLITSDDGDPNTPPATIAPGIDDPNNPNLNPLGVLTLNGNLTMSQDAVLEIELAGIDNSDPNNPQYDQVRISRYNAAVQLDGTLRLKGRDGYTPSVGDAFDVVLRTASSWNRTGQFRVVEVDPDTLPCVEVAVRYLADRVRVEVVRTGDNPDTNGDGCVDDADLLNVLFAFGQTGSSPADVNCDGIVDDADLLSVLFAFGQGC